MARGLSHAIASSTRASDSAGNSARSSRGSLDRATGRGGGWTAMVVTSACLREGGLNHLFLGELIPPQVSNDRAVAKDVDMVALLQFVGFGGVPEEGPPGAGRLGDQIVDLELGADVDAAHRVVHQHQPRVRAERAG